MIWRITLIPADYPPSAHPPTHPPNWLQRFAETPHNPVILLQTYRIIGLWAILNIDIGYLVTLGSSRAENGNECTAQVLSLPPLMKYPSNVLQVELKRERSPGPGDRLHAHCNGGGGRPGGTRGGAVTYVLIPRWHLSIFKACPGDDSVVSGINGTRARSKAWCLLVQTEASLFLSLSLCLSLSQG